MEHDIMSNTQHQGIKTGEEHLHIYGQDNAVTYQKFWTYAVSNPLQSRSIRDMFAVFLAACDFGIQDTVHDGSVPWDMVTRQGRRVFVCSARRYYKSKPVPSSRIAFRMASGRGISAHALFDSARPADMLVFALFSPFDRSDRDPLNFASWEFTCLCAETYKKEFGSRKSVSLSRLKAAGAHTVGFGHLHVALHDFHKHH